MTYRKHITNVDDQQIQLGVQETVAIDALKIIFKETGLKRKVMCHILQKLYLNEASDANLSKMVILANHISSVTYLYYKEGVFFFFFLLNSFSLYIGGSC
jgi:hypothetical protein